MLLVTVDRLFSLWKPKLYYIFNTDTEKRLVQLAALLCFLCTFSVIYLLADFVDLKRGGGEYFELKFQLLKSIF